jgi:biotin-dependent carboxylase-like uncharacterized protein
LSFIILNNPPFATIQDNGRYGLTHLGITPSGAADMYAYKMANKLLDNSNGTNSLEIFHGHITLQATKSTTIALTGADGDIYINDVKVSPWKTYKIKKNDILKVGSLNYGMILYLSVKGGFHIPKILYSNATTIKEEIGGIDGKKLIKGIELPYTENKNFSNRKLQKKYIPKCSNNLKLRVILSYQHKSFDKQTKEKFFSTKYKVTNQINRMGYKLQGEPLQSNLNGIISEGIAFGAIQIPKDGQPIILLKEKQTIGGYPKIAVVLESDCYKLVQSKPGTIITFKEISMDEATKTLHNLTFL